MRVVRDAGCGMRVVAYFLQAGGQKIRDYATMRLCDYPWRESDPRPPAHKTGALPLSYTDIYPEAKWTLRCVCVFVCLLPRPQLFMCGVLLIFLQALTGGRGWLMSELEHRAVL